MTQYEKQYNKAKKIGKIKCVEMQRHYHVIHFQDISIKPIAIAVENQYFKKSSRVIL